MNRPRHQKGGEWHNTCFESGCWPAPLPGKYEPMYVFLFRQRSADGKVVGKIRSIGVSALDANPSMIEIGGRV